MKIERIICQGVVYDEKDVKIAWIDRFGKENISTIKEFPSQVIRDEELARRDDDWD
jgi:hypothetical protein